MCMKDGAVCVRYTCTSIPMEIVHCFHTYVFHKRVGTQSNTSQLHNTIILIYLCNTVQYMTFIIILNVNYQFLLYNLRSKPKK